jgi:hypothetical protein
MNPVPGLSRLELLVANHTSIQRIDNPVAIHDHFNIITQCTAEGANNIGNYRQVAAFGSYHFLFWY